MCNIKLNSRSPAVLRKNPIYLQHLHSSAYCARARTVRVGVRARFAPASAIYFYSYPDPARMVI